MSDPGIFMPGSTGNTTTGKGDAGTLNATYSMTSADLNTPVIFGGQQTTIGKAINIFENLPADQVASWEQSLVSAGLMTPSKEGNAQSRADAFNSLLRFAAYDNMDAAATLSRLQAENKSVKGLSVHVDLANPLDVKQLGDTVAQKLIGRDLTPQEANDITNLIRSQQTSSASGELGAERAALTAQYASGPAGPAGPAVQGGVIPTMAPTSPEAATTQYLTQHDAADVGSHRLLNVFQAIEQKMATDAQGSGPKAAAGPMKVI